MQTTEAYPLWYGAEPAPDSIRGSQTSAMGTHRRSNAGVTVNSTIKPEEAAQVISGRNLGTLLTTPIISVRRLINDGRTATLLDQAIVSATTFVSAVVVG